MRIRLKEMRTRRGWNQAELSSRSGVPQPMISEIEQEVVKSPRIDTLYKLATALRCTVDDLIVVNPSHDGIGGGQRMEGLK